MIKTLMAFVLLLGAPLGAHVAQHPAPKSARKAAKVKPLDLNSASVEALQQLPGVTEALAKRIVAGRPYRSKSNLVTHGILPRPVYEAVRKRICVVPAPLPAKSR